MDRLTQDEIAGMSPPQKLELIARLWDSIEEDQVAVTEAQRAELDRRLPALDEDRRLAVPWADLKDELVGVARRVSRYLYTGSS